MTRRASNLTFLALVLALSLSPARARSPALIAIQPISGAPELVGASLRSQIARLIRARGYRVVTTLPSIEGPGQYWALARDRDVTGFVLGELGSPNRRNQLTVVVVDGAQASVLGRWSFRAPADNPGASLASGFWKHLGPVLEKARAPESPLIPRESEPPAPVVPPVTVGPPVPPVPVDFELEVPHAAKATGNQRRTRLDGGWCDLLCDSL